VVTSARERRPCSPSSLWGKSGEAWRAEGRLSDYSYAGYRAGESEIPEVKVVANLQADVHAAGDGVTDDSEALIAAIEKAPPGAILIPAGTYLIPWSQVPSSLPNNWVVEDFAPAPVCAENLHLAMRKKRIGR